MSDFKWFLGGEPIGEPQGKPEFEDNAYKNEVVRDIIIEEFADHSFNVIITTKLVNEKGFVFRTIIDNCRICKCGIYYVVQNESKIPMKVSRNLGAAVNYFWTLFKVNPIIKFYKIKV